MFILGKTFGIKRISTHSCFEYATKLYAIASFFFGGLLLCFTLMIVTLIQGGKITVTYFPFVSKSGHFI